MSRPFTRKLPAHCGSFSYARIPQAGGVVVYRLFRRDMRRALHVEICKFTPNVWRPTMARVLRAARHRLRNTVDEIDLQIMGVTS